MVVKCGPCEVDLEQNPCELACQCFGLSFFCFMFGGFIWALFFYCDTCDDPHLCGRCFVGQCHSYEPDNHRPNLYPYFVACQAACSEEYQCCNVEVSQGMNGKPSCLQACYESLIRLDEELDVSESVCLDSCARTQCKYTVHGGVQIDMCGYVPGGSCYYGGVIDDTCYSQVCADVPGNHYCESNPAPYDCAAADGVDEFSCVTGCKVAQELKDSF